MNIHIHRGQNQIGGNIVEISTENTKILLDIGLELDDEKNKTLPDIKGLFDYKGYDAVFISHYHGDHLGLAYHIHKDIPLYMGEKSAKIIQASDTYKKVPTIAPYGFLEHKKTIVVGDISVTPYLCDHSAFDSYMLLCEADGESILYTGDFRGNGRKPYDWLLSELPQKVDKLICEGTTLSREGYVAVSEQELEKQAVELFRDNKGPIFVLQSSMNIDRIVTMYRAAKRSGRTFLEELYMADITSAVGGSIPNPAFDDVYAFITSASRYEGLKKYAHRMGKDRIAKTPFVMCVRTSMLKYMKGLSKKMSFEDGVLVYSFWSGYKQTEDMKHFLSECENLGLKVVTLHTSGHADYESIKKLVNTVNPNEIIPIHTEAPEKMIFNT
ncbi:MAG: MBL fold metallo-hydrolase RNA specificity domain-containing protein [Acutalibacteraceae bacterium]|nr:MBL fold metallo-hydrolase RNA specificity domain-containing protein [Acutalibacteraceae bacterium]